MLSAGVASEEVGLVSIHGTGTPLGDPIEVGALGQGFAGAFPDTSKNLIPDDTLTASLQ